GHEDSQTGRYYSERCQVIGFGQSTKTSTYSSFLSKLAIETLSRIRGRERIENLCAFPEGHDDLSALCSAEMIGNRNSVYFLVFACERLPCALSAQAPTIKRDDTSRVRSSRIKDMLDSCLQMLPEVFFYAAEKLGGLCTGRFYTLNALENRVYDIEMEEGPQVIIKFYRPGRWSRATIQAEHDFLKALEESE